MNAIRSKVVIQESQAEPVTGVAVQLLGVLGHDVAVVDTPEAAVHAATTGEPTDLLVLNVTDPDEQSMRLEQLALLPKACRPKQVAILSDAENDEDAPLVRSRAPGLKVQVFVKPVHAMGLLNVIKRLSATN
ncbi:MAG: hypothetical protein QM754_03800 [Tepidisphaeraceae bacterium]